MKTTRLTERYATHLRALRERAEKIAEPIQREDFLGCIDWLAGSLAMGFPVLEQVEIDVLSPGDLVVLDSDDERGAAEQRKWDAERLAAARNEERRTS